jgi:GNAT superfamily N-acetyltransferase
VPATAIATFALEYLTPELWAEITPLLRRHYEEIGPWRDIPLSPDHAQYEQLSALGALRIHTARLTDGSLIGYHCAIVIRSLHYSTMIVAQQDVLWVAPEYRRSCIGSDLMDVAEECVRAEGATVIFQHTKVTPGHDLGKYFMRRGYQPADMIYAKRLDR